MVDKWAEQSAKKMVKSIRQYLNNKHVLISPLRIYTDKEYGSEYWGYFVATSEQLCIIRVGSVKPDLSLLAKYASGVISILPADAIDGETAETHQRLVIRKLKSHKYRVESFDSEVHFLERRDMLSRTKESAQMLQDTRREYDLGLIAG